MLPCFPKRDFSFSDTTMHGDHPLWHSHVYFFSLLIELRSRIYPCTDEMDMTTSVSSLTIAKTDNPSVLEAPRCIFSLNISFVI